MREELGPGDRCLPRDHFAFFVWLFGRHVRVCCSQLAHRIPFRTDASNTLEEQEPFPIFWYLIC